jgi:PAS domain S-box-containing protein
MQRESEPITPVTTVATILVVDDEPTNLAILTHLLSPFYTVRAAISGASALRAATTEPCPDLILLDIMMPDMDGYEVLQRLRNDPASSAIPVVFVSALSTFVSEERGLALGAADYITKPITPAIVLARVRTQLEAKRARDWMKENTSILEAEVSRRTAELSQAFSKMAESEAEHRELFASNPHPMWVYDLETLAFLAVNEAAISHYGYSRDEFLAMTIKDIQPAEDISRLPDNISRMVNGMDTAGLWLHHTKDGRTLEVEIRSHTLNFSGRKCELVLAHDVTELNQAVASLSLANRQLSEGASKLEKSILGTIRVLAQTIEARDPYTAGHQKNVARLCVAIAEELGLSEDETLGLKLAAEIHDLGKIAIPSEILSKPTRLNKVEYELLKMHSETGYDIVKDIAFPWPIAEMIYQHHERIDGSGYPRELKGDETLLEARIISVADVVEAMTAHRPYRPALGIDKALAEIETNRGLLYDPSVADACLRLFREKGFAIEGTVHTDAA